ncbi:MAG TPA: GAF domain-containing protein [Kofleriaceae bacterium]|jgi:signal transduction protein with GAF and PtsI domain
MRRSRPTVQVHHRGDRGVDGILRLIELAGHDGPLEAMLTAMCDELAAIASVDIASIYVRENDKLVMRGNHGFPESAIGTTLDVGEGITGLVAECMRPISAAHAATNSAYKAVPGLGEEQFPVFVGVPLIAGGAAIGVLVLQRRASLHVADEDDVPFELGVDERPSSPVVVADEPGEDPALFTQKEVTLATALGAPIMLAIERRLAAALRSARLAGTGHIPGAVLGRVGVIPTTTALGAPPVDLDKAFARLRDDQSRAMKKLAHCEVPAVGAALDRFALALCDARLRERIADAAKDPDGLRKVAKQYARAAFKLDNVSRTAFKLDPLPESSEDVANLEELVVLLADPRSLHPGAVWIADRIHAFMAIAAVARGAAALVACDSVSLPAIAIARAASIPVVSDVSGLFGWARANDLVAVDGTSGAVLVHPAPMDIEKLRRAR